MDCKDIIYRRKSFRSYIQQPLDEQTMEQIKTVINSAKTLYPQESFSWKIVPPEKIKCVLPWRAPHNIVIYAQENAQSLVNVGFVFQQAELWMQANGIGTCWLGMGHPADKTEETDTQGNPCVMMLAFGRSQEDFRTSADQFKRRKMEEIADKPDPRLECARLAPSAVNSQPWYFVHDGETIHVYGMEKYLRKLMLGNMNKIDIGISLAHIYAENSSTFEYFTAPNPSKHKGYYYVGSFKI